ncbi:MAG: S-layer homology domain-containing protein, partial [Firmicutes bacterium]|nr:S-layer homology domain-containing protein [Bacillota bacterium]
AVFLCDAFGLPTKNTDISGMEGRYEDVAEDAPYYKAVMILTKLRISDGTSATTFSPNKTLTRAQAATFISRIMVLCFGENLDDSTVEHPAADVVVQDDGKLPFYFKPVCAVLKYDIMSNDKDGNFRPNDTVLASEIDKDAIEAYLNDHDLTSSYTISITGGTIFASHGSLQNNSIMESAGNTVRIEAEKRDGEVFVRWDVTPETLELEDETSEKTSFVMPEENVNITAVYEIRPLHRIRITDGTAKGSRGTADNESATREYAGNKVELKADFKENAKFVEWTYEPENLEIEDKTSSETSFIMPDEDVTIHAEYEDAITYKISVSGGESNQPGAAEGEIIKITADTAEDGYTFSQWSGECFTSGAAITINFADRTAESTTFTMPAGDVEITAEFEALPTPPAPAVYTITIDGGKADKDEAEEGEEISITADNKSGYTFSKWSVATGSAVEFKDPSSKNTSFLMPAGNVSIKAEFTEKEGSSSSSGSSSGSSGGSGSSSSSSEQFKDVPKDAYYHDPVYWAVKKGITEGTSKTTFSPMGATTRGQFVTFLWRAAGKPVVEIDCPFEDIEEDAYYYQAVLWAYKNGITDGTTPTTFRPDWTVTRGQAVTFLYRYAGEPKLGEVNPFEDVAETDYYYNAILWAVKKGITEGTSKTTFSPERDSFRAEVVTMLYRQLAD